MKKLVALVIFISSLTAYSQDYYWVGGSGNWSDFANHWATTSGGSTFHTVEPSATDNVYFDANSFMTSGQVVTLDVEANCLSMDWTGVANFPSILGNDFDLNIYGSLTLSSDMTADLDDVEFEGTTTGNTITSNGTELGSGSRTRFNGIGGEWSFEDNFVSGDIYHNAGTVNTNGHSINAGSRYQTSGSSAKEINLGSSEFTADRWWIFGTNQTINAGTSTIHVSSFYGDDAGDGPFTYNNVTFFNYGVLRDDASFNEITVPEGLELELESGSTFTFNSFIADGTKHDPVVIEASTAGTEAFLSQSSGSVTVSYVEMQDVHATGGATFTANNALDNGNNTGWTLNLITGQDYYWVGDGGDWSDFSNHWATTSGGETMHTDYPSKLDNVFFDENSFTDIGQTVQQDITGGTEFNNMDWTGALNEPNLRSNYQHNFRAYGSVTFIEEMDYSLYGFDLYGEDTDLTFTPSSNGGFTFLSFRGTGEYDLLGDIDVGVFSHNSGTVNYNGATIECSIDFDIGSSDPILNFGEATITCRDFTKFSSSTPTITGTPTVTVERDFEGNDISFHSVIMDGNGSIQGSNTLDNLTVTPGSTVMFEAGETQTISTSLSLNGTKSSPINLSSDVDATQATISVASGTVDALYLVMQDIEATGGATFNALQTIDNGNNTGWNITGLAGTDYFWVGDSGNWTDFDSHWATTSGGSTMHTDLPGVLDNVIFDANSFSTTGQTVTVDGGNISFNDMDWTAATNQPTFNASGNDLNVFGSFDFASDVAVNVNDVYFLSDETDETITLQDDEPGTSAYFYFNGSGTWTFQSGFTVRELQHTSGNIDINGQKVLVDFKTSFFGTDPKTMTLGASDFFTRSFSIGSADNLTFDGSSSEISSSSSFSTLGGSGNTYSFNDFTFFRYNSTDEGIFNTDMTFNKLTFTQDTDIELRAGITITVNELVAVGTAEDPITIKSQTQGTTVTISQATGTVDAYYLEMEDVTATGGATFNAFSSIDNGNVSGWTFHRLSQTIDFEDIADKTFGDDDFEISATATSGLDVEFEIVSGNVAIDGTTISILGAGEVQIQASQAGNIDYDPAASVTNTFTVAKADQVIEFESIPSQLLSTETLELSATGGGSNNPVTFTSSDPTVATVSGTTVTFVAEGTTTITASQEGNDNYNEASSVDQDLTIIAGDQPQTITFDALDNVTYGGADFELAATASSGLPVSYVSSDSDVASVNGITVTIVGAGTATITASQEGDEIYNPATDVTQDLVVEKAILTVTAEDKEKIYGEANPELTSTYTGFLKDDDASVLLTEPTVSTTATSSTDVGDHVITVQGGSTDNYDLNRVEGTLTITKRELTAIADDLTMLEGDALPTLTVSYDGLVNGDTGDDIDIPPATATSASSTSAPGEYEITISGGEDNNYLITDRQNGTLTIEKALGIDINDLIQVYPNPANDFLIIEPSDHEYIIEFRTLEGKLVNRLEVSHRERVDLRSLSRGTYLLLLKDQNSIKASSRLIVE